MSYVSAVGCVMYYHSTRSALTSELPASHWLRGEHDLGSHTDGYPRCISVVLMEGYAVASPVGTSYDVRACSMRYPFFVCTVTPWAPNMVTV